MANHSSTYHSTAATLHEDDDSSGDSGQAFIERHMMHARTVMVVGEVSPEMAYTVCSKLHILAQIDPLAPIDVIVSSPGGHVESGDMIHDTIKFITAPVRILGSGWVASAGALIYVAVPRERRFALPNTRFLMHQPSGGSGGKASDIEIQANEIVKMRDRLNKVFSDATGQSVERIVQDTDRDFWLTAAEAVDYGLAGIIISSKAELT
jgi:ATP-dependent Clp protease protease subunit